MPPKSRPTRARPFVGLLASPHLQRRITIVSGAVFIVGVIAFILTYFRGTSDAFKTPISTVPAQLYHQEKTVKPSAAAFTVARTFIETAVARTNLDVSYALVHPDLKGRMTRKAWDTGNIPVIGYPAENATTASFIVKYSYPTAILAEVDLVAKPGSGVRPHLPFFIGLKREDGKTTGRWLVSYWEPDWRPPIPAAP